MALLVCPLPRPSLMSTSCSSRRFDCITDFRFCACAAHSRPDMHQSLNINISGPGCTWAAHARPAGPITDLGSAGFRAAIHVRSDAYLQHDQHGQRQGICLFGWPPLQAPQDECLQPNSTYHTFAVSAAVSGVRSTKRFAPQGGVNVPSWRARLCSSGAGPRAVTHQK